MSQPPVPSSRRDARAASSAPRRQKPATTPAGDGSTPGKAPTGLGAVFAKHPRAWLAGAIGTAFVLVATGVLFAGAAIGAARSADTGVDETGQPIVRPVPSAIPDASRLRTCSVGELALDPALATLSGAVTNATTGELLFDRGATTGIAQGGIVKVITAVAAITTLGPDTTLATRVYAGSQPNTLVLVGGGDPTLSALPVGTESVYAGAPRLDTLADKVEAAYTGDISDVENIVLDATLWNTGDKWASVWPRSAQTGGTLSEITALQVDGDRANPTSLVSPRGTDPVLSAGHAFARALGLDPQDVTFTLGSAVTSNPVLGQVDSQPINVLVNQMLQLDDNTLAEHLARLVSKSTGAGGSQASLAQVLTSSVATSGVPVTGVTLVDGSGTGTGTSVPPAFVAQLMGAILAGGDNLNYVYNSLSVAGESGQLASRFAGTNAAARGLVVGQQGSFSGGYALAGVMAAVDGSSLGFALYASGDGVRESASRAAMETLVTAMLACGDNLSNN